MPSAVVLAVDFGGSKIAATVADTSGRRLRSTTIATVPAAGAQATMHRGIDACHRLLGEVAAHRTLVAVGACTFGIPHENHVDLAPTIEGWGDLAFGQELRAAFPGAELRMSTDVKAAARAEADHGALVGYDPGVYLNLGTGLAAAVVIGGVVLDGCHGAAGEIGYNLRTPADVGTPEPVVLEQAVSGLALADQAARTGQVGADARVVFARSGTDSGAAALVDAFVTELSMHLVNVTALIDPARIVVGGGITGSWEHLELRLQTALTAHTPFPPAVVRARYPFDAALVGALDTALEAARDAHPAPEHAR